MEPGSDKLRLNRAKAKTENGRTFMPVSVRPSTQAVHTFKELKQKHRKVRSECPEPHALRVHRALSWLGRAEQEAGDDDVGFVLLWIGFNAAYAADVATELNGQRDAFKELFAQLIALDFSHRIYNAVWNRFSQEIRLLVSNKYVFAPFWSHHNGVDGFANWPEWLTRSERDLGRALEQRNTAKILSIVFDRLYVLRNQIVHGGATWNSSVNRKQVKDSAAVLGTLLPIFIDIMMDNPLEDWGMPHYPVVE